MYSSLPSASKIYVQSSKTKHKNLSSAKKKRKKAATNICTPVHVFEEETLVSSTSRNYSSSQLSLNSHKEPFENEEKCERDKEIKNSGISDFEENNSSSLQIKCNNNINELCIIGTNEIECSSYLISTDSKSVICDIEKSQSIEEEEKDETNVTADSIYCDELGSDNFESDAASDNYRNVELQTDSDLFSSNSMTQVSKPKSQEIESEECYKQNMNYENIKSIFPEIQLTTENCVLQNSKEISDNGETALPTENEEIYSNTISTNENWQFNKDDLNSATFFSTNTARENSEALSNEFCILNESKDTLKVVSDIDKSSVQSDCCQSSNIYDIHIISSEHSSIDENPISSGEDCRIQSPEQSEKSCTESTMYDSRSVYQNDPPDQQNLTAEKFYKKHVITQSNHKNFTSTKKLSDFSNSSCSFTNFDEFKTSDIIRRSLSLPGRLSNFKSIDLFDSKISQNAFINQNLDKSTFTVDENIFKSSKSTATSETINHYFNKKDVATTPLKTENLKPFTQNKSVATSLKDSTMLIMKVLPPVAVLQARARSYVFGSIGPTGSLLGNEELSRFFPDNKVTIFVGTWNMNGHDPPESIDDFLLPLDISSVPDIYAVGIQESMQSRSEWEILLQTTLGPSHVLFSSTSFGVLHLSIFMRRDLIWFCSEPEEANVAVRPGSMIKTKGAVAICFMFFGTSFLFVNSHLTAHEQKLKERLSDYEKICASLDLPKQIPLKPRQKGKDVTSRFDCVFWSGDLNFRVVQDRSSVLSFVEEKIRRQSSCNSLTEHDQLVQTMAKGMAFHGFNEGVINFIPSYKFDVGTSLFDSTKQRVPSYTDRILHRCKDKSSIACLRYNAVHEIFTSDHKPVYGVFKVSLKPGRDNIRLSGGLFKREIYLEAIKRRAQQLEVTRNHKQSTICSVM